MLLLSIEQGNHMLLVFYYSMEYIGESEKVYKMSIGFNSIYYL